MCSSGRFLSGPTCNVDLSDDRLLRTRWMPAQAKVAFEEVRDCIRHVRTSFVPFADLANGPVIRIRRPHALFEIRD